MNDFPMRRILAPTHARHRNAEGQRPATRQARQASSSEIGAGTRPAARESLKTGKIGIGVDLTASAMDIGSNPLSSTRKSARASRGFARRALHCNFENASISPSYLELTLTSCSLGLAPASAMSLSHVPSSETSVILRVAEGCGASGWRGLGGGIAGTRHSQVECRTGLGL